MKIQSLSILLATLVGTLLCACQSDTANSTTGPAPKDTTAASNTTTNPKDTTTKTKPGADLVGKWSDHEIKGEYEYWDTLEFDADGRFMTNTVYNHPGYLLAVGTEGYNGTWLVVGDKMTIALWNKTYDATFRIEGKLLIQTITGDPVPDTMFRVP